MLSKEIIDYLAAAGLVEGFGKDSFCNYLPEAPDKAMAIFDRPGQRTRKHIDCVVRQYTMVLRNKDQIDSDNWAEEVFKKLDATEEPWTKLDSGAWIIVTSDSPPFFVGVDPLDRFVYNYNFIIMTGRA